MLFHTMSNQANKPKFLMDTNQDPERVADMLVRYQLISKENNLRTQVEEDIPPQNNRIDDTEFFASGPFYAHLDDEVEDDEIVVMSLVQSLFISNLISFS